MKQHAQGIGWRTATAIVIANMIGTGVFTSLGFQLAGITHTWSILLLWLLGALLALAGALSYAELGTHLRRSGGEYTFLSKMYHPLVGYLSGWVSLTVGFAAPVALAAMALSQYTARYVGLPPRTLAVLVVLGVAAVHMVDLRSSSRLQNSTTLLKLLLIGFFIVSGLWIAPEHSAFQWGPGWTGEILLPSFAVSFVYVTFSYSGWNAAAYIADEMRDVRRHLPRALIAGTLVVSALYLLLQWVFLRQAPLEALQGQLEVGQIVATRMYGPAGGQWLSIGIGLLLISSISAMVWAGPRVTRVMGEDHRLWRWFSAGRADQVPRRAIGLQTAITLLLLLSGTFEQVLLYSGFILQAFAALAVGSVFLLRRGGAAGASGFRSPAYPLPQWVFLFFSGWVLLYLIYAQPLEALAGLANLALGAVTYWWSQRLSN